MAPTESEVTFCTTCGAQIFPGSAFCHQCGMKIEQKAEVFAAKEKEEIGKYNLYQVYSLVNNFHYNGVYYDNLRINWFISERSGEPPVPFKENIRDYMELPFMSRSYPENYIKERFTLKEAKLLKLYLATARKITAFIEGCPVPISNELKGNRDAPPPPGTSFISLYKKSDYNLPFKVEGVFNTRMAEERIMGDDASVTIVSGISVKEIERQLREKEREKKQGK